MCEDDTDDDDNGQHDPYVSAVLRRWHNKREDALVFP